MTEDFKQFESDGWSAQAASYDLVTGRATVQAVEPLLELAGVGAGARVLDVATGLGAVAVAATARGATAVGVDLADGMLDAARGAHPGIEFVSADAEDLPFETGSFDSVIGAFVLNHLPHPDRCAAEAARVTTPGGGVAFAVWDHPERARLTSLLGRALAATGVDRSAAVPDSPDDFRFADDDRMRTLLLGAGLTDVRAETLSISVRADSADELWDGLRGGTVRTAATLAAQDDQTRARVREAFDSAVAEFALSGGGFEVPTVIKLGAGRRPDS